MRIVDANIIKPAPQVGYAIDSLPAQLGTDDIDGARTTFHALQAHKGELPYDDATVEHACATASDRFLGIIHSHFTPADSRVVEGVAAHIDVGATELDMTLPGGDHQECVLADAEVAIKFAGGLPRFETKELVIAAHALAMEAAGDGKDSIERTLADKARLGIVQEIASQSPWSIPGFMIRSAKIGHQVARETRAFGRSARLVTGFASLAMLNYGNARATRSRDR